MSALPKIKHVLFKEKLPHNGETVQFRPFTVKEEKILLYAEQDDESSIIDAIKQIITNCVTTPNFDVNALPMFAVEFLFMRLRAKSVNNIIEIMIHDKEDDRNIPVRVDLDEIKVFTPEGHDPIIKLGDTMGLVMDYPALPHLSGIKTSLAEAGEDANAIDILFRIMAECIGKIYDGDTVLVRGKDFSTADAVEFLEGLSSANFKKIQAFFDTIPYLYHKITYQNSKGEQSVELKGLASFF